MTYFGLDPDDLDRRQARRQQQHEDWVAAEYGKPLPDGDYLAAACGCLGRLTKFYERIVEPCETAWRYHNGIMQLWKQGDQRGRAYGERAWDRHIREAEASIKERRKEQSA